MRKLAAVLVAAAIALTGCAASLGDKGGAEGTPPDLVGDVDYVAVYRSADNFPNIALQCVQGIGFATSATGRGESGGATPLIRVSEWDALCKTKQPK